MSFDFLSSWVEPLPINVFLKDTTVTTVSLQLATLAPQSKALTSHCALQIESLNEKPNIMFGVPSKDSVWSVLIEDMMKQ